MLPEHLKEKLRKFRKSKVRYNLQYYNKTYYLHSFKNLFYIIFL